MAFCALGEENPTTYALSRFCVLQGGWREVGRKTSVVLCDPAAVMCLLFGADFISFAVFRIAWIYWLQ